MNWDDVVGIGLALPEVEVSTSYGTPSLKVRGKLLTRLRPEDDSLVLTGVGFDERELLIEADPQTFHTTAHYKDYPSVLARWNMWTQRPWRGFSSGAGGPRRQSAPSRLGTKRARAPANPCTGRRLRHARGGAFP